MISVIVPVYNIDKSLCICLESVLNQTYHNFEVLLIDDGSVDSSGEMIDEYVKYNDRIRLIHQKNKGVSNARNMGLAFALGDYICFLDSDDNVDKDYLRLLYNNIINSDLAICGFNWIYQAEIIDRTRFGSEERKEIKKYQAMDFLNLISAPWAKLFFADIIRNNRLFFPEDLSYGEDMIFNLNYLDKVDSITIINKLLYNYITDNSNSLLRRYNPDLENNLKTINSEIYYFLSKWEVDERQWQLYFNKVYYDYENVMRNTFTKDNPLDFWNKLKYNDDILKSKEFQTVLNKTNIKINRIFRLAYKSHAYWIILLYNAIVSVVKKGRIV